MKKRAVYFIPILIILSNSTIVLCGLDEVSHTNMIHLEIGTPETSFLNTSETKSHQYWIYLDFNRTYSVEISPSWNSSDADFYFYFNGSVGIINIVDKVAKGSPEKYEYHCTKSGRYYIEVFSDLPAYYTITVRDITYSNETCLVLFVLFLIYEVYYIFSKRSKRKKKKSIEPPKSKLGRFVSNEYVQLFLFICSIIGMIYMGLDLLNFI